MIEKLLPAIGIATLGWVGAMASGSSAAPQDPASEAQALASETARCSSLKGKHIADSEIVKSEFVPAGTAGLFGAKNLAGLCRVEARISPVPDSIINIVVLMPSNWNGKLAGLGGSGFEGGFGFAPLVLKRALDAGFAGVATDAGHASSEYAEWALNQPQRIVDYGHRANHLGAVVGKAVIADYYGSPAKRSYFQGCSNGGRDGLMLAQRYPEDYDAIASGAPAYNFTAIGARNGWIDQILRRPGVNLTPAKLKMVSGAVIAQCDARDGVEDGLIENPKVCRFKPAELQCKPGQRGDTCLSEADIGALETLYRGPQTQDGRQFLPGATPGSEYDWHSAIPGLPNGPTSLYRYMVYSDPDWDFATFDIQRDHAAAQRTVAPIIDATDTDLRPFVRNGGRLLMYQGWDDLLVPADSTLDYYTKARRKLGREGADHMRLFMLPGVGHCLGGNGPDAVNMIAELDRWVESGVPPERIIATKLDNPGGAFGLPAKSLRTRPLCAWPKRARYKGTGSVDDAASFVCK